MSSEIITGIPEHLVAQPHPEEMGGLALQGTEIQYRTESSRSVEDAEKYKAIETLKQLGFLTPVQDLELYHGRAANQGENGQWAVDSSFNNGGNATGNWNVNGRTTLYAGTHRLARDFANARVQDKGGRPEVHQVTSPDTDATILNGFFDVRSLSLDQARAYHQAMMALLPPILKASPLTFEQRGDVTTAADTLKKQYEAKRQVDRTNAKLGSTEVSGVAMGTGHDSQIVESLAGSINANDMLHLNILTAANAFLQAGETTVRVDGKPINNEYLAHFFKEAHIVGVEYGVWSGTLDRNEDIVAFFDLDRTQSASALAKERRVATKAFGALSERLDGTLPGTFGAYLSDAHVKPERLLAAATKQYPALRDLFNKSAGNWEGYTLGEHTESVLRNFDENYADKLPADMLAPMRLALLAHDLGKSLAVEKGEKHRQELYNAALAEQFFTAAGVEPKTSHFLRSLIGEGSKIAARAIIGGDASATDSLVALGRKEMRAVLGREATEAEINGYLDLAELILTCDGGAYTSMATTRTSTHIYRNAPAFDNSFKPAFGLTKSKLALKNGNLKSRRSR